MKIHITAIALIFLGALPSVARAQTIERLATPSGVTVSLVKCSRKNSKCLNKAAEFCAGSYQVLGSESHSGGMIADILPGPVTWYSMTFLCGKTDGAMPRFPFSGPQWVMPTVVIPRTVRTTCNSIGNSVTCYSN